MRFNITVSALCTSSISQTVTVEADSEEEAKEICFDELQDGSWRTDHHDIDEESLEVMEVTQIED